jgi:hypothetical protein
VIEMLEPGAVEVGRRKNWMTWKTWVLVSVAGMLAMGLWLADEVIDYMVATSPQAADQAVVPVWERLSEIDAAFVFNAVVHEGSDY